jgi:hypothetical protein
MRVFIAGWVIFGSLAAIATPNRREVGPLPLEVDTSMAFGEAYRIESFGGLELSILATVKSGPGQRNAAPISVAVEGPFKAPKFGDDVDPGTVTQLKYKASPKKPGTILYRVVLEEAGVYRILPNTDVTVRATCTKKCARPVLTPTQILKSMRPDLLATFRQEARAILEAKIENVDLRNKIIDHVHEAIDKDLIVRDRAALVPPFSKFHFKLRPLLPGVEGKRKPVVHVIGGDDLFKFLGKCNADRTELPEQVSKEKLPNLRYGHYLDQSLTNCEISHSRRLSDMLTSLAAGNGSTVTVETEGKKETLRTPKDVIEFLLRDHEVRMQSERTYADFFALAIDGHNSIWPLWLDTGIPMTREKNFQVPMGHSQISWYIRGPKVQARFAFFLGMGGTGFFPLTERRPNWTGMRAVYKYSAKVSAERNRMIKAMSLTPDYYQYNQRKVRELMLPMFGYTYLGVCNDTTALFEQIIQGTNSTYPQTRVLELADDEDDLPETLRAGFAALPHDADIPAAALESDPNIQKQMLKRITWMIPFDNLSGLDQVDPNLRLEMRKAIEMSKQR